MARYSLFVLKVPLNPKQTNKQTCSYCRAEQPAEWSAQAADEGSVRRAVSDGSRPTELAAALSADADGSSGLGSQWLTDAHQSGFTLILVSV